MVPAMPIISPIAINPLIDGRQSERAMLVRRGVQRLLMAMGAHVLPELSLATGRRADLVALTRQGDIWIIEIKSSIEDFRVDRKWPDYRLHSDRFFFATHPGVPAELREAASLFEPILPLIAVAAPAPCRMLTSRPRSRVRRCVAWSSLIAEEMV